METMNPPLQCSLHLLFTATFLSSMVGHIFYMECTLDINKKPLQPVIYFLLQYFPTLGSFKMLHWQENFGSCSPPTLKSPKLRNTVLLCSIGLFLTVFFFSSTQTHQCMKGDHQTLQDELALSGNKDGLEAPVTFHYSN